MWNIFILKFKIVSITALSLTIQLCSGIEIIDSVISSCVYCSALWGSSHCKNQLGQIFLAFCHLLDASIYNVGFCYLFRFYLICITSKALFFYSPADATTFNASAGAKNRFEIFGFLIITETTESTIQSLIRQPGNRPCWSVITTTAECNGIFPRCCLFNQTAAGNEL